MDVAPEQKGLVSPNVKTMAEAPFEPESFVRAMWLNGRPVGLLARLRPSAYPATEDIIIRRDLAYTWRLMVDKEFQGQGLGTLALDEARRVAIEWGYPGLSLTVGTGPY